jgi:hypothetical protein
LASYERYFQDLLCETNADHPDLEEVHKARDKAQEVSVHLSRSPTSFDGNSFETFKFLSPPAWRRLDPNVCRIFEPGPPDENPGTDPTRIWPSLCQT